MESTASTVTTRSATSSSQVRRAGAEYAIVLATVHAVIAASTTQAQPQCA